MRTFKQIYESKSDRTWSNGTSMDEYAPPMEDWDYCDMCCSYCGSDEHQDQDCINKGEYERICPECGGPNTGNCEHCMDWNESPVDDEAILGSGMFDPDPETGELNYDLWKGLGIWEVEPSDEEVIQAVRDGELDKDEAIKILQGFGWERMEAIEEINDVSPSTIERDRHQQSIWKEAGLDDDSLDDMGNIIDDIDDDYDSDYESEDVDSIDDLEDDYEDDEWEDWN